MRHLPKPDVRIPLRLPARQGNVTTMRQVKAIGERNPEFFHLFQAASGTRSQPKDLDICLLNQGMDLYSDLYQDSIRKNISC